MNAPVNKPSIVPPPADDDTPMSIAKPVEFSLDQFRSTRPSALAGVETLLTALPHHSLSQAKDFVRLHPNEETHWSKELCFVSVPIKGQSRDTLHLINEDLAMRHLSNGIIQRFRLALASKPDNVFFLCHVPSTNLDNAWNQTNLQGCEEAKTTWVKMVSRKEEGIDGYKIERAIDQDAFAPPNWPSPLLDALILTTFSGRMILREDHPGLLRLIGAKQSMS
jgi:hypothetical protein